MRSFWISLDYQQLKQLVSSNCLVSFPFAFATTNCAICLNELFKPMPPFWASSQSVLADNSD